jgi:cytochrome c oxidase assembly protein subunit 15
MKDIAGRMAPYLRPLAWTTLVANILIVVTGGVVRLTGSGLGCPTWPQCQGGSLVPHGAINHHKIIEFSNRSLTDVLVVIAIATVLAAWTTPHRKQSIWIALGIPAQAVLGGITVLTDLNPWVVSLHLMLSMVIIALSVWMLLSVLGLSGRADVLGIAQAAAAAAVLYLGTVVTGAGPHAGDEKAHRNGLSALQTAQLHADAVFLLTGLTIALVILRRSRAAYALLAAVVLNAIIGFIQYFTHLPVGLVAAHMFGASLVAAASTWLLLERRNSLA